MRVIFSVLYVLALIYFLLFMVRLVLEWVQVLARDWRPRGLVLVVAEGTYTVTDPPLRLARRVVPPLRLGRVALDLGFLVVVFLLSLLMRVLLLLASV